MTTMLLDLNNFAHRCRAGFTNDGSAFLFKFVRNLRALVAEIGPSSLVFVKEGSPEHRYELFPEYKGHRRVKKDDPEVEKKWKDIMELKEQVDEAVNFCLKNLEVTVIKHAKCEADDLIANVARALAKEGKPCVVASNDKDFAQLLFEDQTGLIKVFDTGTKEYVAKPEQDPLVLKAIQGDKSDNIPGIPGYGPKKAAKLAAAIKDGTFDLEHLGQEHYEVYQRNHKLVKFFELDQDAWRRVEAARGKYDPAGLMIDFCMLGMESLTEKKTYDRICETFGSLKQAVL
jgi:5'-3' exonuclease